MLRTFHIGGCAQDISYKGVVLWIFHIGVVLRIFHIGGCAQDISYRELCSGYFI